MPRYLASAWVREDHRPSNISGPTPQLTIVEIGEATKQHAHRDAHRDVVANSQEIEFVAQRDEHNCEYHADETAMETHAAIPHAQQLPFDPSIARKIG